MPATILGATSFLAHRHLLKINFAFSEKTCIFRPVLASGRNIVGPNSAWLFSSSRSVLSPSVSSLGFKCLTGNVAYRPLLHTQA